MFSLTVKSEKAAFAVVSMTVDSQLRKRTIEGFCDSAYPSFLKREKKVADSLLAGPGKRSWSCQDLSGAQWDGKCQWPKRNTPRAGSLSKQELNFMASASHLYKEHREWDFWWVR